MKEKRKENRIIEEDKVVLSLVPEGNVPGSAETYHSLYSLTQDISAGGVRIITDSPLPVDSNVRFEIALSKTRQLIHGTGKVRWLNRLFEDRVFEAGLEFTELGPEGVGAILEHIYGHGAS
jgi:c-di-GMP-binding flagellar brake protein YcgR